MPCSFRRSKIAQEIQHILKSDIVENGRTDKNSDAANGESKELSMSSLLYKGHSIIYGAALDRFTGKYAPKGQLLWHGVKGKHGTHSFTLSELFPTADQAKAAAAEEAIAWAERRLVHLKPK